MTEPLRDIRPRARQDHPAALGAAGPDATAPVIVLTYAHTGVELLTQMLSASRSLVCTTATGLLPLCHEAIDAWQRADGRQGQPSPLAIKSVRTLATTMITAIQARSGARRWCETAFTGAAAARTFLQVFPGTAFLCLHRTLEGVFSDTTRAYPWGLGDSPFWPFSTGDPGNNAATVAAYWATRAGGLLDFEAGNPGSCLRLRYEDLTADPRGQAGETFRALGLDVRDLAAFRESEQSQPTLTTSTNLPQMPVDRIPAHLLTLIRQLHSRLGYEL